jgi:hypothetical protein
MPVQQLASQTLIGWPDLGGSTSQTTDINSAAIWIGSSIPIYDSNTKIKEVKFFFTTLTGSLAASDLTCTLYQDAPGPQGVGTAVEGPISCDTTPTANSWLTWTLSGTTALTAGRMYYAIIKNANATPASNHIVIQAQTQDGVGLRCNLGSAGCCFATSCKSTNSGGTWAFLNAAFGWRVKFADGTYEGNPHQTNATDSSNMVYGTREQGVQFQLPWSSGLSFKIKGAGLLTGNNLGTPTQNARLRLYTGALGSMSLQGTSVDVPKRTYTGYAYGEFVTPVSIPGNALLSVVLGENANADTSSNTYRLQSVVWDSDSNSLPLQPYGSTTQNIYFNGSTWSAIGGNAITPWVLLLDTAGGEIVVTGTGSGSPIGGRGSNLTFFPVMTGWMVNSLHISPYGMTSSALNAANTQIAFSFRVPPNATQNMKEFRINLASITGSMVAADLTASLVASNNSTTTAIPNSGTVIESVNCDATPAAGWNTWTFAGTSAMVAGSNYWIILKNLNATPASNFPTVNYTKGQTAMPSHIGGMGCSSWTAAVTTDGSTWTTQLVGIGGYRIKFVDGSSNVLYDGMPISAITIDTTNTVFNTREVGLQFTLAYPSNLTLNIKQLGINFGATVGTPTGDVRLRLYTGAVGSMVLQGTTVICSKNDVTEGYLYANFTTPVSIPGNSTVTVAIGETANADTSTNAWRIEGATWDPDSNSLPLMPYAGTLQQVYFDGSSWAAAPAGTQVGAATLIFDSVGGEFTLPAGGGGGGTSGMSAMSGIGAYGDLRF